MATALKAFAFNGPLNATSNKERSSTDVLLRQLLDARAEHGVSGDVVRAADFNIKPGVTSDEGALRSFPRKREFRMPQILGFNWVPASAGTSGEKLAVRRPVHPSRAAGAAASG